MTLEQLIREGRLEDALEHAVDNAREHPTNADYRYQLVSLFVIAGELERAEGQLRALAAADPTLLSGTAIYASLLQAEEERRRVFAEGADAPIAPDANETAARRAGMLSRLTPDPETASSTLATLQGSEPSIAARVDGTAYANLADYDDFIGPTLEVFAGGRYLLVPMAHLASLEFSKPKALLDLIWAQVKLVERSGVEATAHVPVLYAGTAAADDPMVRLGRKTEWEDIGGVGFRGLGQRILTDGEVELPLLSIRRIDFDVGDA